ncbi:Hypothetical protein SRAE_0000050700 [Strongyloides ratti]|uniref:Uncharacterized protein n=1 Tax=Strongyloides ratti TaxID=34506 RepID=A0A090KVD1_STRRB|nr:Hypothetical protein SRAE_0000050700 [Strongyloides ratti]CEF61381.1 Hypothetical protein SRAE_0000050700 [Strongyloides ratti]
MEDGQNNFEFSNGNETLDQFISENTNNILENLEDSYSVSFSDNCSDHNEDFDHNSTSLFKGTNKSTEEFISRFLKIKLKGEVSDNTSEKFLKLFCDFLPSDHNCSRTIQGIRSKLAYSVPDVNNIFKNTIEHDFEEGRLLEFSFMEIIKLVIKRNLTCFLKNYNGKEKILDLLLHTDGAPLSKSSKVQIWPVSAIFLDLPPKIRIAFHNVVLFSIW